MSSYCDYAPAHPVHAHYHDHEYGFPLTEDAALFERLVLEINQAGLSWETILRKRDAFRRAYDGFDIDVVASYGERDRQRLLQDAGVIRNRLKIDSAIENARRLVEIRDSFGSFEAWLEHHHPIDRAAWTRLFRNTFKFMGPEIVGEFLMSTGYLPGAHHENCPVYARIIAAEPKWRIGEYR
jgi:DNA-3-methyladenine glycosylase I